MPELDSLRGIAILLVLFYHGFASRYGTTGLSGLPKFLVGLTAPGWAGVNLFFALSGFLITGILLDSKPRPDYFRRFYWRRALRILPAYYALLILLPIFGRYGLLGESVSWRFLALSAVYLANVTVLFGVPMQFGVLWSLAVEEHFYLIWPVIVRYLRRGAMVAVAIFIAAAATLARVIAFRLGHDALGHYTWLVADGLAFGSLLALLARSSRPSRALSWLIIVGAVAGIFMVVVPFRRAFLGGALDVTALNLLCAATVAVTLLLGASSWNSLVRWRILRFFGEISYGLYLIHMLVFNIFDSLQRQFFPEMPTFKGHFGIMLVRFAVSAPIAVGVAALSRRYFEEPFLRLKDRLRSVPASSPPEIGKHSSAIQPARSEPA
jgi:peptidoglycan/LPS O-acetylase OafA/YrhL